VTKVRNLSTIIDTTARQALYTEVLTTLHDEAIFLPITAKRQIAVTNQRVSGFQFGFMEYDLPLANLYPSSQTRLVITAGLQTGFFQQGSDIGSMNPHDYRPNEFVTNDFVFEGLVAWDGAHTAGVDGVAGNDDDFVQPSLAVSWTTNYAAVVASPSTPYEITFALRTGVTFHDGSPWNAAAAKANFDQIMGASYGLLNPATPATVAAVLLLQ
jgi:ABC-type transport system substrate-binding protein